MDKVTTGGKSLMLFVRNVALVGLIGGTRSVVETPAGLASTSGVLYTSVITLCVDHDKSYSISQLIKGTSSDLQQLLGDFNGITTSVPNLLLTAGVLLVLTSKDVLIYCTPICINFICIDIHFISIIIPQTF